MSKVKFLLMCLVLACLLSGSALGQSSSRKPGQACYDAMAARRQSPFHIFGQAKNLFKRIVGFERTIYDYFPPVCITELNLSQTEILSACRAPKKTDTFCPVGRQTIRISVTALNVANDVLTYSYNVSGGEIVGRGPQVTWDLSDATPGTYTVSGCVDNGVGCVETIVRQVKVVECPNCR